MKQDRFLIGILAGIGVLVLAALLIFFLRKQPEYVSDATPEGVVHNYILAIYRNDYEKAYGYLAEEKNKPAYGEFQEFFFKGYSNSDDVSVEIGETLISGAKASVALDVVWTNSDPFSGRYSNVEKALLVRQAGDWKLTQMPYQFWSYDWYQESLR